MVVDHEIVRANKKSKQNVPNNIKPPEKVKKLAGNTARFDLKFIL